MNIWLQFFFLTIDFYIYWSFYGGFYVVTCEGESIKYYHVAQAMTNTTDVHTAMYLCICASVHLYLYSDYRYTDAEIHSYTDTHRYTDTHTDTENLYLTIEFMSIIIDYKIIPLTEK